MSKTKTKTPSLSRAGLTTLRYWNPADNVATNLTDPEDHLEAGFDGLAECLDAGLLAHVPASDSYTLTTRGHEVHALSVFNVHDAGKTVWRETVFDLSQKLTPSGMNRLRAWALTDEPTLDLSDPGLILIISRVNA